MASADHLRGSCSCGRNHYVIIIPPDPFLSLQVLCDESADQTRPLTLRTPLTSISSTTHAFYPDETHSSIRRTFTPPHAPHTRRHFCGYCGTRLSYWSEESADEAEHLRVDMGSLKSESLDLLMDVGLLGEEDVEAAVGGAARGAEPQAVSEAGERQMSRAQQPTGPIARELKGNPWFEEIIEGSRLGRIRRRRGGETTSDETGGKTTYEWEVVEIGGDDGDSTTSTLPVGEKRKLGEGVEAEDSEMKG